MTCNRNLPVLVNLPTPKGKKTIRKAFLAPNGLAIDSQSKFTQASPDGQQILPRDTRGQIGEVLGAVVDAVLVAKPEAHARLVGGGEGVRRGDEVLDRGAHVICQFREERLRFGFGEGTHVFFFCFCLKLFGGRVESLLGGSFERKKPKRVVWDG